MCIVCLNCDGPIESDRIGVRRCAALQSFKSLRVRRRSASVSLLSNLATTRWNEWTQRGGREEERRRINSWLRWHSHLLAPLHRPLSNPTPTLFVCLLLFCLRWWLVVQRERSCGNPFEWATICSERKLDPCPPALALALDAATSTQTKRLRQERQPPQRDAWRAHPPRPPPTPWGCSDAWRTSWRIGESKRKCR
jgi:hypothetical protein